jgi:hypothetical protein
LTSSPAERLAKLAALKGDFPAFAAQCLKIKGKDGKLVPFVLNKAQRYIHGRLEEQRERIGYVRALLLKGRQQGASTYIGGRYYHRTSMGTGVNAFILTHEQDATDNLFKMVDRYHTNNPLAPQTGAANAKELNFPRRDSGYTVGTAGTKAVGRSKTILLLHGSEAAFWPHAATHFAGVVQAVPSEPGSEVIIESTANGLGGEFHERWQQAEAGIGDYQAIFVPWFWQDEYRRPVPADFLMDDEEAEYAGLHGCDAEQMVWRRAKIAELKDPLLFKQEYPATAAEAFQTTGHDSYISAAAVLKARKTDCQPFGPLVAGADPARFGDDRFSIALRRGRKVLKIESKAKLDVVQGANWCRQVIDEHKPSRMFIDVGGLGAGVVDILHSWGSPYDKIVVGVNFGSAPHTPNPVDKDGRDCGGYVNRRAEMWGLSKDWLDEVGGVDLPDSDSLQADACGPSYKYDVCQRVILESKQDMRSRGFRSPDEWDAVALTFAEPVKDRQASSVLTMPNIGVV